MRVELKIVAGNCTRGLPKNKWQIRTLSEPCFQLHRGEERKTAFNQIDDQKYLGFFFSLVRVKCNTLLQEKKKKILIFKNQDFYIFSYQNIRILSELSGLVYKSQNETNSQDLVDTLLY